MTESDLRSVAAYAVELASLRQAEPARVLVELVEATSALLGLAAGAAPVSVAPGQDVVTAGPATGRAALVAGFGHGPGAECARSGRPFVSPDLVRDRARWLTFVVKATAAGVGAAWALPIGRDEDRVGTLLLLGSRDGVPDPSVPQVLADAAAVGALHTRELGRAARENDQLREALHSRVVVEQAKGMIAERAGIDVDEAFALLRGHARRQRLSLTDVAGGIVRRGIEVSSVIDRT